MEPKSTRLPRKITPHMAVALQTTLSSCIAEETAFREIRYVAGTDAAYEGKRAMGAAVVIEYGSLRPIETVTASCQITFPYVPGLLAFREAPVVVRALRKLRHQPDICLVDGHGLAHPRRFGLACHVGLIMDMPTIGVAKSRLIGKEYGDGLFDADGRLIAKVIRLNGKRLYVSVGNKISLSESVRIVKHCIRRNRLELLLLAHQEAEVRKWQIRN